MLTYHLVADKPATLSVRGREILEKAKSSAASASTSASAASSPLSSADTTKVADKPRIAREAVSLCLKDLRQFNQDLRGGFKCLSQCMDRLGKDMPGKSIQERTESDAFTNAFCRFLGRASRPSVTNADRYEALQLGSKTLVDHTVAVLFGQDDLFSGQPTEECRAKLHSLYRNALQVACLQHGIRVREQHPGRLQSAWQMDSLPCVH